MTTLTQFDPESDNPEIRKRSCDLLKVWSPHAIIYNPLKAGSIDGSDTEPHDRAVIRAMRANYKPNFKVVGKPECTIFVGRLSPKTSEESLKREFSQYGTIIRCRLVRDIVTGRAKGYAFIEYSNEKYALKAYKRSNRTWLDGSQIFVDMSCAKTLPGWVPRRLGGGFNGRKESGQLRFGGRDRPFKKPIQLLTKKEIINYADRPVKMNYKIGEK